MEYLQRPCQEVHFTYQTVEKLILNYFPYVQIDLLEWQRFPL